MRKTLDDDLDIVGLLATRVLTSSELDFLEQLNIKSTHGQHETLLAFFGMRMLNVKCRTLIATSATNEKQYFCLFHVASMMFPPSTFLLSLKPIPARPKLLFRT